MHSWFHILTIVLTGVAVGILSAEHTEKGSLKFGLPAILWCYLLGANIGLLAAGGAGMELVPVRSGRDVELELNEVSKVVDSERWRVFEDWSYSSLPYLGVGLLIAFAIIKLLNWKYEAFDEESYNGD